MWTIRRSRPDEQDRLFDIWHDAVKATHGFLSRDDFEFYARLVRDEMLPNGTFWVACDNNRPLGFIQLEGERVEGLFVDPAHHGQNIGRALVDHALALSPRLQLDVNERSGAVGFYRRLGFRETGYSATDGTGRPYPLVHMAIG